VKRINDVLFKRDEILAMAGAPLDKLIKFALVHGFGGLEALSGIPATVGGAIVMNAGAFINCISDKLTSIYALYEDKPVIIDKQDCGFSYRKSKFLNSKYTILSATFSLDFKLTLEIENNIKYFIKMRRERQPVSRSCGSVFKNTSLAPSGLLIEKCGLKGFSLGNASVSNVHANFINLKDGCTAKEVYELIKAVKNKVKEKYNILLHEEVEFLGDF
jgi:UDP-N-acetylmuramate dehydrogenase